jgi:hypothetical protein
MPGLDPVFLEVNFGVAIHKNIVRELARGTLNVKDLIFG